MPLCNARAERALLVPHCSLHDLAARSVEIEGIGLGPDLCRVDLTGVHCVSRVR